ncbi:unnamed protein product [Didymodactylos carnosus]|uniref:HTH psq-type domain-containing protein n=1 Tax=Didymodactylos carnosus TaxID=1234261 RepID=A0A815ZSZ1_9BILA|nr:unnamed protein product [Didymodactylos carnosus]CAF1588224.1 unnamed protein product [Didymodactylos carnosus]CAF4353322.1 unnamed protein product [Didymodactylos carnosus]CAF4459123.1 unnamed protein product [Didymodactylos carnosus]
MSASTSSRSYSKPQYTSENVKDAVAAYKSGSMTSVEATKTFKVPESTIRNHAQNSQLRTGVGRKAVYDNKKVHNNSIYETRKKRLCNFLNRWKNELKRMREKKLERARKIGFTEEIRVGWFNLLHDIMSKNDLLDKPRQIFNCDETGFSDQTKGRPA